MKILKTTVPYLAAFLVSNDHFELGRVYIKDSEKQIATIEINYDEAYEELCQKLIDLYEKKKAMVLLNVYQNNIRFIMKLINLRKNGIQQ